MTAGGAGIPQMFRQGFGGFSRWACRNFSNGSSVKEGEVQIMAFSLIGSGAVRAQLNMTPMIDVLLVLIIIFVVIAPTKSVGLDTLVPQPSDAASQKPPQQIVISILADGGIRLNQEAIGRDLLEPRLLGLFRHGGSTPVFIRGDKALEYRQVTDVIDIAKRAGINRVGLMGN